MIRIRPHIAVATLAAPALQQIPSFVEAQHRRRRNAAFRFDHAIVPLIGAIGGGCGAVQFHGFQRSLPVNQPDVILRVHRYADHVAHHPVIRATASATSGPLQIWALASRRLVPLPFFGAPRMQLPARSTWLPAPRLHRDSASFFSFLRLSGVTYVFTDVLRTTILNSGSYYTQFNSRRDHRRLAVPLLLLALTAGAHDIPNDVPSRRF